MSQLTLYFSGDVLRKLRFAARREKSSVSELTARCIRDDLTPWPENLIRTFGALAGTDFELPSQPRLEDDIPREAL